MSEIGDKQEIFNHLEKFGCCKRCKLRFLGDIYGDFEKPDECLNKILEQNSFDNEEHNNKKVKLNTCLVCLDLLQDYLIEEMIQSPVLHELSKYDCNSFNNFISFPVAILIREHSMEVYLKKKYPDFYKDHRIYAINKAWSKSIQSKLSKQINKTYDKDSTLQIQFVVSYEEEEQESSIMHKIDVKNLSRNTIGETLKSIDVELFKKHVSVPPEAPNKPAYISKIMYHNEAIYIAGRYCKYSRKLGQTPWVINNVQVFDNSVQDIMFKSLEEVFDCKSLVFSSSGREDCDVRTLGRGRPFFIRLNDSKLSKLSSEKFREIEREINQSQLIKVQHLQFIDKKLLSEIKDGEQFKKKTYRALCVVDKPEQLNHYMEVINNLSKLILLQKTPIRVFHRRSSIIRPKEIYSITARRIEDYNNLFELDVVTQAGTYVKEFVHGDLGRTKPSLRGLIGGQVDIVCLDVLDIDLNFPPVINYE